jgi:hypothetical protein
MSLRSGDAREDSEWLLAMVDSWCCLMYSLNIVKHRSTSDLDLMFLKV